VWHPSGTNASSGLNTRVRDGVKTVMGRLQKLRNAVSKDSELKELASSLATDAQSFITELLEFVTTQYEDLVETSTMSDSESWELVVDCVAHIFEELHNVRSELTDDGQYNEGMFLWTMLREWEIQERYREKQFKNDPALTGLMARIMMVHSGEKSVKTQLALLETPDESIESLGIKLKEYHKEQVAINNKVKALVDETPEGSKSKKG
jgi:uncharacterized protein YneF (UPF0154 family)